MLRSAQEIPCFVDDAFAIRLSIDASLASSGSRFLPWQTSEGNLLRSRLAQGTRLQVFLMRSGIPVAGNLEKPPDQSNSFSD